MSQTLLDRNGVEIQIPFNIREERASFVQSDKLPDWLKLSFILAEDKRFHSHPGVDLLAVFRALSSFIQTGNIVSGASTITMQLARIYWPELSRPRYKLAQMIQAMRLETTSTKTQILNHYLSVVPFAHQIIGLPQACVYFFDKSCSRLSIAEGATLAILPRNPNHYLNNKEALNISRNKLLNILFEAFPMDSIVQTQALSEDVQFNFGVAQNSAHHFSQRVLKELETDNSSKVHTTLDLFLNSRIQKLLAESISKQPKLGNAGAVLVAENRTGNIIAYVGSPGYFSSGHGMLDAVQSLRSPGSALKPFVYTLALESGWTLSSVLPDIPLEFKVSNGVFSPKNYGGNFSGPQQIRYALANSKNIPVLYLTAKLGEARVLDFLKRVGFTSLTKGPEHYGVGVSLGNGEVSLWELVQAYSILANQGEFKPLRVSQDSANPFASYQAFSKESAYLITDTLSDPHARSEEFGRGSALEFDYQVAVKTGTSSSYRDHWVVGYTKDYTVGVWKGNANGSPMSLKVPSSRGAGLLFKQVVQLMHSGVAPQTYHSTDRIVSRRVCSLSGDIAHKHCSETRVEKYKQSQTPQKVCQYHKIQHIPNCQGSPRSISYIKLPNIYRSWAEANLLPTYKNRVKELCGDPSVHLSIEVASSSLQPEIVEPIDGSNYALDPTIPASHQRLRISVSPYSKSLNLKLLLNGKEKLGLDKDGHFDWVLQKGEHRFQLMSGKNKMGKEKSIYVR